jgi:tetratricopeptide (TPR) repeat protein
VLALMLESWDPRLGSALTELALGPTPERHRRVASEYRRLGVLDMAHTHLTNALRLDPGDAAAHDGLARIWRDWGFPHLGLADGLRAVELAPRSPVAANTLGTLYAGIGQLDRAYGWYARALSLEPGAPYAVNNFCYTAILLRRGSAVDVCQRAVAVRPESRTTRNNLGLAYAASGDVQKAREQFASANDEAAAHYNMGIVFMAQRQYDKAVAAFEAAARLKPAFPLATARARQSRVLLARYREGQDDSND